MEKYAIQMGKWGSILGALAGVIELSVGTKILPWIGNKDSPFILGLVTMLLSSVAFYSINSAGNKALPTNNRKLAIFLGVFLPAVICITTVGRLWYLPGSLLLFASFLLAYTYWIRISIERSPSQVSKIIQINQILGAIGSLVILTSIGLAFFINAFGLFQSEISVEGNIFRFQVVPMDILRLDNLSTNVLMIEDHENRLVMFVYILLLLGASVALISSLAASHVFRLVGGVIVLAGLILFSLAIPMILHQMGVPSIKLLDLFGSLELGWYASTAGVSLIMIASLCRFRPRY